MSAAGYQGESQRAGCSVSKVSRVAGLLARVGGGPRREGREGGEGEAQLARAEADERVQFADELVLGRGVGVEGGAAERPAGEGGDEVGEVGADGRSSGSPSIFV